MFGFRKLKTYQLSKVLAKYNYKLTKNFPNEKRFVLAQQMNQVAVKQLLKKCFAS